MNTQSLEIYSKIIVVKLEGGVGVSLTVHYTYSAYIIIQIIKKERNHSIVKYPGLWAHLESRHNKDVRYKSHTVRCTHTFSYQLQTSLLPYQGVIDMNDLQRQPEVYFFHLRNK